ncbi:hypothetical protein PACTADRAFT_37149 [Pachysolen tannophilus NRRL Y-2460]|uniref:Cytochrome b-c1 complex subunit 7 n=1 Tax=Pachysolen tannophilus NRRL Y-2460 TaxID=669874 RepID=A0A1E4U207_PACTA|nr:hypothetical protein PACTADRAFT_37149 [Pachysolen tannophilus NRRL Y-2460]
MASLTSVVKQCDYILKTPVLRSLFVPASKVFVHLAGYREMGLRLDDILIEETPIMQKAIHRLPNSETYARNYRILTAQQLAMSHQLLPKSKVLKLDEDVPYLTPFILEAEAEAFEKDELDNIIVVNK